MEPNIAYIGHLIGDTARSRMLTTLMSGKALTATELSVVADITPQTASSHLTKLVEGELLTVRKQGRHKYFQLRNKQAAELIEQLLSITASVSSSVATGPNNERLRKSRICYDHLAGELAVELFDSLSSKGWIVELDQQVKLTDKGKEKFNHLGIDFTSFNNRRPMCKACLDWSERRSHLAGNLGAWVLQDALQRGWAKQDLDSRAIQFTSQGLTAFKRQYEF